MKFPSALYGMKMACGENPKRVYGEKGQAPSTRMGNMAGYRAQWIEAQQYMQDWADYENQKEDKKPSKPQIHTTENIEKKLLEWRKALGLNSGKPDSPRA